MTIRLLVDPNFENDVIVVRAPVAAGKCLKIFRVLECISKAMLYTSLDSRRLTCTWCGGRLDPEGSDAGPKFLRIPCVIPLSVTMQCLALLVAWWVVGRVSESFLGTIEDAEPKSALVAA